MRHRIENITTFSYLLIMVSILTTIAGCNSRTPRDFSDSGLLIDENIMPSNWSLAEYSDRSLTNEGQESGAYIIFYATDTPHLVRGGEDIYRYKNKRRAAWHYRRFERDYFNNASVYRTTPWLVPNGFNFSSIVADQWRFSCAGSTFTIESNTGTSTLCGYLAQYDEFLIFFSITAEQAGKTFITLQQVSKIVEAIDQKMGEHIIP